MKYKKQVDKSHYDFCRYMSKARWSSMWHQLDEVQKLKPERVLEVGQGAGVFKLLAAQFDISVETLDIDPDLKPDLIGTAMAMPFKDGSYDVVCAFQMLEHLPYPDSLQSFREMVRVSRGPVVISLPDAQRVRRYQIQVPKLGIYNFLIPCLRFARGHEFNGQHYWEINKRGYSLSRVIDDLSKCIRLIKTYRVYEYPYHRFFIFER